MQRHRPLRRVKSLVHDSARPESSALATRPDVGANVIAVTTSEADTVIRAQFRVGGILDDVDDDDVVDDDVQHGDDDDRVWRRRTIIRGSERAVPLGAW